MSANDPLVEALRASLGAAIASEASEVGVAVGRMCDAIVVRIVPLVREAIAQEIEDHHRSHARCCDEVADIVRGGSQ